ncbi:MAG: phosphoribosylaminoimidazolesuccinocarboxamide synthase [Candidatus Krumholzibacteria bacterium]|nr:phosphoribosylaminoimidazolesuccinocarboxamide synthase [Candidatus Krumholzibacteria bacterium]MDH5269145.1 phosphoribosylaminoimidazolesuccinocarboxamide synthase [Candidatus Krumholzibacteria bacterium]
MQALVSTSDLGLTPDRTGKVRDVFDLGDHLLIVSTDRISAYDVILPSALPGKGILLTQITIGWYEHFGRELRTHFVSADIDEYPAPFKGRRELAGRSMLVRKADRFDVECVVRGYLSGSGWKEYRRNRAVCGVSLPEGLTESAELPQPIFTPATKADDGHDENIPFEEMCNIVARADAEQLRSMSIDLYRRGRDYARARGIILADTKFEFGRIDGEITLIDEMLTPDSSRFWPADRYAPGGPQESFDKQFVRDYLDASGWDHSPPGPQLPADVVNKTIARYREAHDRLFPGRSLERYL